MRPRTLPSSRPVRAVVVAAVGVVLASLPVGAGTAEPLAAAAGGREVGFESSLRLDFAPAGARTLLLATVNVPIEQVSRNEHGFYNLEVKGEVQIDGRSYDRFAYRFDVPAEQISDRLPLSLTFDRMLRPGEYRLVLQVEDLQTGSLSHLERELGVPGAGGEPVAIAAPVATPGAPLKGTASPPWDAVDPPRAEGPLEPVLVAAPPAARAASGAGTATASTPASNPTPIRLLAPPRVVVGKQRFWATTGPAVRRVEFLLDGRTVLTRSRPPFEVELDLGSVPTLRRLEVVAYDERGARLGEHRIELNAGGTDRFAVRLGRPPASAQGERRFTAVVDVAVPRGARLDRVELFLDEERLAVLGKPPFRHPVTVPSGAPVVLRAVAHLGDGHSAEDAVLLNAPHATEVDVELAELYATVVDPRGRPVRGLSAQQFRVVEEGEPQALTRFAEVEDLPVNVALLLDTSGSMSLRLPDVAAAAGDFLREILTPRDRISLITFDDAPRTRVGFTADAAFLANGLEGLRAGGGTRLHDSLAFALEELARQEGQRVLVLLSDGVDEGSSATVVEVLELARRCGAAIYAIGLADRGATTPSLDRQLLTRLAEESGGRAFFARSESELAGVYGDIEEEMRSRYLLAYYSSHAGDQLSFRMVDLQVMQPRLSARTVRGYYP
jgi:Ca-activated chloride channel family protein